MRQALDMSRRVLGSEHPDVAGRAANLAYWLIQEGQFEEAGALVDESIAIRRKVLGPNAPQVAGTLTVKANLMLEKRYAEARESRTRRRGSCSRACRRIPGRWPPQ